MTRRLVATVLSAVLDSVNEVNQDLAGYALLVDGGLLSVYAASATSGYLEEEGEDMLTEPFDWPECPSAAFEEADALLADIADSQAQKPYEARVRTIVDSLVEALEEARGKNRYLEVCMLMVACGDGDPMWDKVEAEARQRLNPVR